MASFNDVTYIFNIGSVKSSDAVAPVVAAAAAGASVWLGGCGKEFGRFQRFETFQNLLECCGTF